MYIPSEYREEDPEKLLAFMQAHSFATLVSIDNTKPIATHLPFVVRRTDETITLVTHMSKGNSQWKSLGEQDILVIFQGPQAYISPTNYADKARVPTWNYIAVHAYGKARITTFDEHDHALRAMIDEYEPSYMHQYETLPDKYKLGNMKGIVCLEIVVDRIEASYKLSQDKSHIDQAQVARSLGESGDQSAQEISRYMRDRADHSER
jgi:transcriptional regulator